MCLCPTALWLLIDSCALIKTSDSSLPAGMHLSHEIRRRKMRTTWVFKKRQPVLQLPGPADVQREICVCRSLCAVCGSAVALGEVYAHSLVASRYSDILCSCPGFFFFSPLTLWYNGPFSLTTAQIHWRYMRDQAPLDNMLSQNNSPHQDHLELVSICNSHLSKKEGAISFISYNCAQCST